MEGFRRRFGVYKVAMWAGLIVMFGGPILASRLGEPLSSAAALVPLVLGCLAMLGALLALLADLSFSTAPEGRRLRGAVGAVVFTLLLTVALVALAEWLIL